MHQYLRLSAYFDDLFSNIHLGCRGRIAQLVERPSKVPQVGATLLMWVRFPRETIYSRAAA